MQRPGYLAGAAVIDDGRERHDLRSSTWAGPAAESHNPFKVIDHTAQFIIFMEKRSVFDRLVQERFHLTHPCVLATVGGYPGRRFLTLIRDLHGQLQVPFYVLADNDPAGYSLFFFIARGIARCHDDAIPSARYLGLRAHDCERYGLDASLRIDLSRSDLEELRQLKSRHWLTADGPWQRELDRMSRNGFKIELEALTAISTSFFEDTYLPEQLASGRYLQIPNS